MTHDTAKVLAEATARQPRDINEQLMLQLLRGNPQAASFVLAWEAYESNLARIAKLEQAMREIYECGSIKLAEEIASAALSHPKPDTGGGN